MTDFAIASCGKFHHNACPMGLKSSPSQLIALMRMVTEGIPASVLSTYMDDVVTHLDTFEQTLQLLEILFLRLRYANLRLNPSKCSIAYPKLEILGNIVSGDSVEVSPKIITAITEFPTPKNRRQVKSFCGILNFVRRFLPDFAMHCSPLFNLLKKNVPFIWSKQCNDAFEMLKKMIVSAPILIPFSPQKTSYVFIDSSYEGLGGPYFSTEMTSCYTQLHFVVAV